MRSSKPELYQLYNLLASIVGDAKTPYDGSLMQLQFPCPHCVEVDGESEKYKYNLEVNFSKQVFQCWKCTSGDNPGMKGSILKLIRKYGTKEHVGEYQRIIKSIKESRYYDLEIDDELFSGGTMVLANELELPQTFQEFGRVNDYQSARALSYLTQRGLDWQLIKHYEMGYTSWESTNPILSNRVVIPSFDSKGVINYWVARDITGKSKFKYMNPKVKKEDIVVNENKINWDADITLCEGLFDSIVIPNSIPMLGKSLNDKFKLYWDLKDKCNANINLFLDGDAKDTLIKLYHYLNRGVLRDRIRCIFVNKEYDPSLIYQTWGRKGIISCLRTSTKIEEEY